MGQQATFDKVVAHLRRQRAKATGSFGLCVYRSTDDKKCAVGCLIPDHKYSPSLEGQSLEVEFANELKAIVEEEGHDLALVRQLQVIHDRVFIHHWETEFEKLARRHRLEFQPRTVMLDLKRALIDSMARSDSAC
jgi:hypothetical protein